MSTVVDGSFLGDRLSSAMRFPCATMRMESQNSAKFYGMSCQSNEANNEHRLADLSMELFLYVSRVDVTCNVEVSFSTHE